MAHPGCASIRIATDSPASPINANLFGLHLEHIWNCVYPCLWVGPDSPVPNVQGVREELIYRLSALRPALCKYPGGYFSDFYDWRDGVGPREGRPGRVCPTQPGNVESNHFGTAEFVSFCRNIGAEPLLSVNTTSIEASTAAAWVEYCNSTGKTYWAEKRREHGHHEPLEVKYWAIGNEPYWLHSPAEYAERYRRWTHWMYNTDPSIAIIAGGVEPGQCVGEPWNVDGTWGERFLELTGSTGGLFHGSWHPSPDERTLLYSFHPYFSADMECSEEEYYRALTELEERLPESIARTVELLDRYRGGNPRPGLCLDEYGLLQPGFRMDGNMTQPAPFWAALWLGVFFHLCFEHSPQVSLATLPGVVNMEHELLLLEGDRIITTPSYHVFGLLREHGDSERIECVLRDAPDHPALPRSPLLCAASLKPDGCTVTLSVINLDLSRSARAHISFDADSSRLRSIRDARARVLFSPDIHRCNSASDPDGIVPREAVVTVRDGTVDHEFPEHSITVFTVTLG